MIISNLPYIELPITLWEISIDPARKRGWKFTNQMKIVDFQGRTVNLPAGVLHGNMMGRSHQRMGMLNQVVHNSIYPLVMTNNLPWKIAIINR